MVEYFEKRREAVRNNDSLTKLDKLILEKYIYETEINVRKAYIMYYEGTKILLENIKNNNINEIDLNKCKFINYVVDIINAIQNNASDTEIKFIINYYTGLGIGLAKMMTEMTILSFTNPIGMLNVISDRCNLNEKSEEGLEKIYIAMEMAYERLKEKAKPKSEDNFDSFIKLMKWYYRFCMKSTKEEKQELSTIDNGFSRTKEK